MLIDTERLKCLWSASGFTLDELHERIVAIGQDHWWSRSKRLLRNAYKVTLRFVGCNNELVYRLAPTRQTLLLEYELRNFNSADAAFARRYLNYKECERVLASLAYVFSMLPEHDCQRVIAIYLRGSLATNDRWPNDIDATIIVENMPGNLQSRLRESLAEMLNKPCDLRVMTKREIDFSAPHGIYVNPRQFFAQKSER